MNVAGPNDSIGARIRWGASLGLMMGATFSAVALLNALFSGGQVELRSGTRIELFPVLRSYLIFGPFTGIVIAAVLPWMRNAALAYVLGCIASIPIVLSVVQGFGDPLFAPKSIIVATVEVLTLGGFGGLIIRSLCWRTKKTKRAKPVAE